MNLTTIHARDLPDAWFQCIYNIIDKGTTYRVTRGSFAGQERLEFDHVTVHITHPNTRPLLPEIPHHYNIPNPVAEGYIEEYMPYLMASGKLPNEEYTYGEFLEPQISQVIRMFKEEGYWTNQACMTVGDRNSIDLIDPPCLRLIDCRIKDGKLHFIIYFRSWDLWGGFPANLAAIQLLKEYMADEIGVGDGEIIASSKGMHLYDYIWDLAKLLAGRSEEQK